MVHSEGHPGVDQAYLLISRRVFFMGLARRRDSELGAVGRCPNGSSKQPKREWLEVRRESLYSWCLAVSRRCTL